MSKALKAAIEANDAAAAAKAIQAVKDLSRKMPGATTPVLYACQTGADAVLDVLLDAGAPPKGVDGYAGNSPFVVAMQHGHTNVMRRLHARGVVTPEQIEHAMFVAVIEGRVEALRVILRDLRQRPGGNLVHHATRTAAWAPALLRLLAEHGADVNGRWQEPSGIAGDGRHPMHTAAANGSPSAVRTLAELGADVNVRDDAGRTPIIALARNIGGLRAHNETMARMRALAAEGKARAGPDTEDAEPEATLAALLELGADATLTDAGGNDALAHYEEEVRRGMEDNEPALVEALKRAGARGAGAKGTLFDAIAARDVDAVRAALAAGADPNAPNARGSTPLTAAAYGGPVPLVTALLLAGADPNRHDGFGGFPLLQAAVAGNLPVVQRLLEAGADLHLQERRAPGDSAPARNALLAAEWNRKYDTVDYLKSIGGARPKPKTYTPLKPGVESWNDFSELLVRADVSRTAAAVARTIGGTVHEDAYGQSFKPGRSAYVVVRPRGMNWSNVLRVAPPPLRFEPSNVTAQVAQSLAEAAEAPVLSIQYSDTSGSASIDRFEPDGTHANLEDGWDRDMLEEVVEELGDEATDAMKQRLAAMGEDEADSSTGLVRLAETEKFNVAALGFMIEPGRAVDVEFAGYPAEAFEGVAWVSN